MWLHLTLTWELLMSPMSGLHLLQTKVESRGMEPGHLYFKNIFKWSWCTVKFGNQDFSSTILPRNEVSNLRYQNWAPTTWKWDAGSSVVAQCIQLLLDMPASHIGVPVEDLAALLLVQIPSDVPARLSNLLGPCHVCRRLRRNSRLLTSTASWGVK